MFNIQPTAEQQAKAQEICSVGDSGEINQQCVYDYYATGNEDASKVTATTNDVYGTAQTTLG